MTEPNWSTLTKQGAMDVLGGGAVLSTTNPLPVRTSMVSKLNLHNVAVTAGVNITTPITSSASPVVFRIYCVFNIAGVLNVRRYASGSWVVEVLNGAVALTPNAAHTFDILVDSGDSIVFRYTVTGRALTFKVIEIRGV